MRSTETFEILRVLARYDVEFVIVGMTGAILHGVPAQTLALDILYLVDDNNIPKLSAALSELEAELRADLMNRRLRPNITHLQAGGHILLKTKLGQLDVLGSIEESTRYEDITSDVVEKDLGDFRVKVLSLRRLIEAKAKAGRPKDLAMLPVLHATLREIERQEQADSK